MSITRSPAASPWPQTIRSGFVGTSLRCRLSTVPSAPMVTSVLYKVARLNEPCRSWIPQTTTTALRAAAS